MTATDLDRYLEASPSLAARLPGIERAAASEAPILILGEAGTGRSTLARALHSASGRARRPLVEVDAAALPVALFESELFGYRAGAFTGAERSTPGRLARARDGSVVLDHVEEIPLAVQPKLLRLLSERRYAPLGGEETTTDARFIAIGAPDLQERATRGAFRSDLYWRLEVLAFTLPPLGERLDDLPRLAGALLADLAERFARPALELSERAMEWMRAYSWPGNLRELRNRLERALVLATDSIVDPAPPREATPETPKSLEIAEREAILAALEFTRGHQGRAAEILGISRKGLWEKRKRLGIP